MLLLVWPLQAQWSSRVEGEFCLPLHSGQLGHLIKHDLIVLTICNEMVDEGRYFTFSKIQAKKYIQLSTTHYSTFQKLIDPCALI